MRTYFIVATGIASLGLLVVVAARAADSYGVAGEQLLTVKGKVVDLTCELAHDCVADCGNGKRPLGLLTGDGKLYVAAKSNTIFAGLGHDLKAYCGKEITADGLTTTNYGSTLLMIQRFKESDTADWVETSQFALDWAKQHNADPSGKTTEEWYRSDLTVKRAVLKRGKTGLDE